jgi:diaminopimelate epimerase
MGRRGNCPPDHGMSTIPFIKMHGAGNDFVVLDLRGQDASPSIATLSAMADRHKGIGCDQIVLIERPLNGADIRFRFHNADGSVSGACGNGTRCAASKIMCDEGRQSLSIETLAAILNASMDTDGRVTVDMGPAQTHWSKVPLASDIDTLHLPLEVNGVSDPVAVGMGNPHCVFFVNDAEAVEIERIGPVVETHELFPEKTNVEFVSRMDDGRLRMRVWERGVGITLACGSGVCAVVVAAAQRGIIDARTAEIVADGGMLTATLRTDGHVLLSGPVATSFLGSFNSEENL